MWEKRSLSSLLLSPMLKWYLKSKYAFPKSYSFSFGIIIKFYTRRYEALLQSDLVALDAKSSEFQYKRPTICLTTNVLLGIIPSPACSFCGKTDEFLEHIFVTCHYTKKFRVDFIKWMGNKISKL